MTGTKDGWVESLIPFGGRLTSAWMDATEIGSEPALWEAAHISHTLA